MKVLHVVEAWKGGIASYVEALIKDQAAKGYTVYLLADSSELDADSRDLGVEVIGYQSSRSPLEFPRIARDVAREIKRISPDVVHCHSTFPGIYVRLLKHACKVVYTPHAWSFFKQDVSFFHRCVYKFVERFMGRNCERIICMSLEEIKAARTIGIEPEKLSLVYTGIPSVDQGGAGLIEGMRAAGEPLKVGFFGRFDYQKGFDLIEGVAPLLNSNVEINLFGGVVRDSERVIDPRFIVHGWIDHEKIHDCMSSVDVVLIPSRWEGFALTPLEAMRARRPVVISAFSSLPETVIHGFNGLILSDFSVEGLAALLNSLDRGECYEMGENAAMVYEKNFRFEDFSEKIDNIYRG